MIQDDPRSRHEALKIATKLACDLTILSVVDLSGNDGDRLSSGWRICKHIYRKGWTPSYRYQEAQSFLGDTGGCEIETDAGEYSVEMCSFGLIIFSTQAFYRECILWKSLNHQHVLPFYGVAEDLFSNSVCIILPWMENGRIRDYVERLRRHGRLMGQDFPAAVVHWVRFPQGPVIVTVKF